MEIEFENCRWYTTMEIPGHGVVRGEWDHRQHFDSYIGGVELSGKRVLDVGAASGFVTFEVERRGAEVVAFDPDSADRLYRIPHACNLSWQDRDKAVALEEEELERLKNGFWFAHRKFNSSAKAVYGDVYSLYKYFPERFDVVLMTAIIEHLRDPVTAIGSAARVCRDTLVIGFTLILPTEELLAKPMASFSDPTYDRAWWVYSLGLYRAILKNVGFRVESVKPAFSWSERLQAVCERQTLVARVAR